MSDENHNTVFYHCVCLCVWLYLCACVCDCVRPEPTDGSIYSGRWDHVGQSPASPSTSPQPKPNAPPGSPHLLLHPFTLCVCASSYTHTNREKQVAAQAPEKVSYYFYPSVMPDNFH